MTETAPVVARIPRGDRVAAWTLLPVLGAVAGGLVSVGADWAADAGVPLVHGLLRLLARLAPPVAAGGAPRSGSPWPRRPPGTS
jgi:hypothetical protein